MERGDHSSPMRNSAGQTESGEENIVSCKETTETEPTYSPAPPMWKGRKSPFFEDSVDRTGNAKTLPSLANEVLYL